MSTLYAHLFNVITKKYIPVKITDDKMEVTEGHNKGGYMTPALLRAAHPTGNSGDIATIQSTNTVWMWDTGTVDWFDSGLSSLVTSVAGRIGDIILGVADLSDFDTGVSNNTDVAANTTHRGSDGSDHDFIDQDVTSGASPTFDGDNITEAHAKHVDLIVRKGSAGTINKGQPVYIDDYNAGLDRPEVELADANDPIKLPVIALAETEITNSADATIIKSGRLIGTPAAPLATNTWAVGDILYISNTVGTLQNTKPIGPASKIQAIGQVLRSHISLGVIEIFGAGRVNDIPIMPISKTIENPTSSENTTIFYTKEAITITEMIAVLQGSATPSVTWSVRHSTDRSAAGNEVVTGGTTTTSVTTGSIVTSFNDATIPANSFVWITTTAQSGTVDELAATVRYRLD